MTPAALRLTTLRRGSVAEVNCAAKVKNDGLHFPPDNYCTNGTGWGECPQCQYFPAPVRRTTGLKACVVDQLQDPSADSPDFYSSSVNLHVAWLAAGMRANASFTPGGHCQTASYSWIANCLDDGTGRLLGGGGGSRR